MKGSCLGHSTVSFVERRKQKNVILREMNYETDLFFKSVFVQDVLFMRKVPYTKHKGVVLSTVALC
jgi:hypothetical protein